jgi:putative FmdB family regulatory protein
VPTYSYRCTACGNAFDIQQSMSDASLTDCPACGGPLRKVFSPIGVTFNGSGFYRTDSRKSGSSTASATSKSSGGDSSSSSSSSSTPSGSGSSGSSSSGSGSSSTAASSSSSGSSGSK